MTGRNPELIVFGPALSEASARSRGDAESKGFQFRPGDGLWRDGRPVSLPPRAFGVLTALVASPGTVVAKRELMDAVWPDTFVTESSLLEAIGLLRDTLGDDPRRPTFIQTVHRRGYRFIGQLQPPDESPAPFFSGPEWRPIVVASATYAITTVCVAIVFALFGQRPIERRTSRFSIALPGEAAIDPLRGSLAVSSDGSHLVYVAAAGGRTQLFLRSVDRDEPSPIAGTEDASDPFFSPDGKWVGFFARGSLQKVRLDGGTPTILSAARPGAGATWTRDGTIVFGGGPGGGLARTSASGRPHDALGAEPLVLAAPRPGSRDLRLGWPDMLPGDRGVLFTSITLAGTDVGVLDLRTGVRTTLARQAAFARYSPTGHVVFERGGRLEAARFSLHTLSTVEPPSPIVTGIARGDLLEGPRFAFSQTGALVYIPAAFGEQDEPHLWDSDVSLADPWLATSGGQAINPTWRPDGLEIAFAFSKAGPFNVFMKPVTGSDGAAPLLQSPFNQFPTSWAPDASALAFTEFQPLTGADIWVVDLHTRARRALVRTLFDETWARFSPDGRSIAYMSNESGRWEVYLRPSDGGGLRERVSTNGGVWPCWSADGKTIYFSAGGRTMAAAIRSAPSLTVSSPIDVPGADAMRLAGGSAPDRLLARQAGNGVHRRAELRVVLEWFNELTRRVRPS